MKLKPLSFRKAVTTAGTREQLTTSERFVTAVTIQAVRANTNNVYVGDNQVSSANGIELDAGESITLSADAYGLAGATIDMSAIWLDVDTSSEGVNVFYLERSE